MRGMVTTSVHEVVWRDLCGKRAPGHKVRLRMYERAVIISNFLYCNEIKCNPTNICLELHSLRIFKMSTIHCQYTQLCSNSPVASTRRCASPDSVKSFPGARGQAVCTPKALASRGTRENTGRRARLGPRAAGSAARDVHLACCERHGGANLHERAPRQGSMLVPPCERAVLRSGEVIQCSLRRRSSAHSHAIQMRSGRSMFPPPGTAALRGKHECKARVNLGEARAAHAFAAVQDVKLTCAD